MLSFTLLLSVATVAFAALGPKSTLTIANKNISPDGSTRAASVINGIHPGPLITAKKGDRFNINVVNNLTDPVQLQGTSIHWHGFLQKGTNFMDGVVGVTQCPIAPNASFLYSFNADSAGTFWYHSHFDIQYCDGVRGPLIVYDPSDPLRHLYDVDDESTIITLSEWYQVPATTLAGITMADSTLINGKGRFPGGPNAQLTVVNVSHTVDSIQILAGQRYSVVLNANQPVDNYWIRALPNAGKLNISSTFENGVNSAILKYKGAPDSEPKSHQQNNPKKLVETDLHPLTDPHAPGKPTPDGADNIFNLTLDFDQTAFMFKINNKSFVPPTVPVLLQILSGAHNAHELLPEGSVFTLERNKVVQINIPSGLIGGPHPFHLDGHKFSVIRSADSGKYNFLDPVRRDVVNVGETEGDHVAIRFQTDNPGPWILRCHINFHFIAGLAIVFAEAPENTLAGRNCGLDEWEKLCPKWDMLPDSTKHAQVGNTTMASAT